MRFKNILMELEVRSHHTESPKKLEFMTEILRFECFEFPKEPYFANETS